MADTDVDDYLSAAPEPQRTTLTSLRATLAALLPDAEQVIAYSAPCFKVDGVGVAGFAAFTRHCSYLPMSGNITTELADELGGYTWSKGALQFPVDTPLPEALVRRLVEARQAEIARRGR